MLAGNLATPVRHCSCVGSTVHWPSALCNCVGTTPMAGMLGRRRHTQGASNCCEVHPMGRGWIRIPVTTDIAVVATHMPWWRAVTPDAAAPCTHKSVGCIQCYAPLKTERCPSATSSSGCIFHCWQCCSFSCCCGCGCCLVTFCCCLHTGGLRYLMFVMV